jgi:hypothetical protein
MTEQQQTPSIEKTKHVCLNGIPPALDGWKCVPPAMVRRARLDDTVYEQIQDFYTEQATFHLDVPNPYVDIEDGSPWRVHEYIVKGEIGTVGTLTEPLTWDQVREHFPQYAQVFEAAAVTDETEAN